MIDRIDPINDPRWEGLVNEHDHASVFHTVGWLRALKDTYGFRPVAYTTASAGTALTDGLVLCDIDSWLTGRRSVSLPFSDHCRPLVSDHDTLMRLLTFMHVMRRNTDQRFIEIRPFLESDAKSHRILPFLKHRTFLRHAIDLTQNTDVIFSRFNKSERYAVHRAEREGLAYEAGASSTLLKEFYSLLVLTRRRQGLPPQPFNWFANLKQYLKQHMIIRIARRNEVPVAGMVTLSFRGTTIYKYACSDRAFGYLGGAPFLCWKAIQEEKAHGAREFDLGRSDTRHEGLISFKERLGAQRKELVYYRDAMTKSSYNGDRPTTSYCQQLASRVFLPIVPTCLFIFAGRVMYRHVG
jgi:hypothetical protein